MDFITNYGFTLQYTQGKTFVYANSEKITIRVDKEKKYIIINYYNPNTLKEVHLFRGWTEEENEFQIILSTIKI